MKDPAFVKKWKDWARSPRTWRGDRPLLFATFKAERVRCNGYRHQKYACTTDLESEHRVDFYAAAHELKDLAPWLKTSPG